MVYPRPPSGEYEGSSTPADVSRASSSYVWIPSVPATNVFPVESGKIPEKKFPCGKNVAVVRPFVPNVASATPAEVKRSAANDENCALSCVPDTRMFPLASSAMPRGE